MSISNAYPSPVGHATPGRRLSILHNISSFFRESDVEQRDEGSSYRRHRVKALFRRNRETQNVPIRRAEPSNVMLSSAQWAPPPPYSILSPTPRPPDSSLMNHNTTGGTSTSRSSSPHHSTYSQKAHPLRAELSPTTSQASMQVQPVSETGAEENGRGRRYYSSSGTGFRQSETLSAGCYTPSILSMDEISWQRSNTPPGLEVHSPSPIHPSFSDIHDSSRGLISALYHLRREDPLHLLDRQIRSDSELALAFHLQETYDMGVNRQSRQSSSSDQQQMPPICRSQRGSHHRSSSASFAAARGDMGSDADKVADLDPGNSTIAVGLRRPCIICHSQPDIFHFPARLPTQKCIHESDVCGDCLRNTCLEGVETSGWKGVTCPQCEKVMVCDDVLRAILVRRRSSG